MRIVILGCAGSGKTTLARQLGECTGAPVICLDAIWQPHRKEKDVSTFRNLVKKAHAGDEWISDGNFAAGTLDIRLPPVRLQHERPIPMLELIPLGVRLLCLFAAARYNQKH
jgi:adenylate kinase family enzyme